MSWVKLDDGFTDHPKIALAPITVRQANAFVERWHRHSRPVRGGIVALAAVLDARVVGVAVLGRPVARRLHDGRTVEVTRVATDGTRNACSFLYGAARRVAAVLGYERVVTYTRAHESGASLRGAGFQQVAYVRGRSWSCPSRPRVDYEPWQGKFRWESVA
jgi:hypothetical protein